MFSENKEKPFDLGPILPMFGAGVDLGERLGAMDSRLKQLEAGQIRLETKLDAMDAKFEAKTDKMANAIHRLDERMDGVERRLDSLDEGRRTDHRLLIGILAAVVAGFFVQFFAN